MKAVLYLNIGSDLGYGKGVNDHKSSNAMACFGSQALRKYSSQVPFCFVISRLYSQKKTSLMLQKVFMIVYEGTSQMLIVVVVART